MKTYRLIQLSFMIALGSIFTLSSCLDSFGDEYPPRPCRTCPTDNIDSLVFKSNERPLARTYTEWINEWLKTFPYDICEATGTIHDGIFTVLDRSERVYFLAGATGITSIRNIDLESGKPILFPVVNVVKTYPCLVQPGKAPAKEQTLEDFLRQETAASMNFTSQIKVSLDGLPYQLTAYHRIITPVFKTYKDRTLGSCFDACIASDRPQDAISDGYWIMLKGLEAGDHVLTFKGGIPKDGIDNEATYHITVR